MCRPHHYREVQARSSRLIYYILPALAASVLVNVTKFLEVKTVTVCYDYRECGCELVRRSDTNINITTDFSLRILVSVKDSL